MWKIEVADRIRDFILFCIVVFLIGTFFIYLSNHKDKDIDEYEGDFNQDDYNFDYDY